MTRLAPKTPSARNRHTIPARWSAAKINIHPTIDSTTHHASATRHGSLLSDRKPQRRSRRPGPHPPDTETALTSTLHCARSRIHGAWSTPYRLLTHALAGRDLPSDIDLNT